MTFYQFLCEHNVNTYLFEQNCLEANAGWDEGHYGPIGTIWDLFQESAPFEWLFDAFDWDNSLQYDWEFWSNLDDQLDELLELMEENNERMEHGWPSSHLIIKEL